MSEPRCECAVFWPDDEGHHPECPVGRRIDELKAELSALRNSVRQKSVQATEQQLREVTAERDTYREALQLISTCEVRVAGDVVDIAKKAFARKEPTQ